MKSKNRYAIGVMSGTSLDGIDLVYVEFKTNDLTKFTLLYQETVAYSKEWKLDLQNAISFSQEKLKALDISYGRLLAKEINTFIDKNKIDVIDFIASHGHTVLHQPENGITLQIGNGQEIANLTKQKIVCDFRTQDVALGGQGAPLVPIGDELLFSDYDFCLNLGGFANVSFKNNKKRIAFDICPVNIVLNHYCRKIGLEFDNEGEIASEGKINTTLLEALNRLSFYKKQAPKSLGLEWVQVHIFPLIDALEQDVATVLRTFVEHVAQQISKAISLKASVLITGGGAFNSFLIDRIGVYLKIKTTQQSNTLINYKEALIFAFLGLLRIDNQVNCLSSVTGAEKDHSSGNIFLPIF